MGNVNCSERQSSQERHPPSDTCTRSASQRELRGARVSGASTVSGAIGTIELKGDVGKDVADGTSQMNRHELVQWSEEGTFVL